MSGILILVVWMLIIVFGVARSRARLKQKQNTKQLADSWKEHQSRTPEAGPYEKTPARPKPERTKDAQLNDKPAARRMPAKAPDTYQPVLHYDFVRENLMQEVQDLIVMGPDTSLPFERDFVAEGMEMVRKYIV